MATVIFDTSKIPAQRRFMESTSRELLYSGSFGAGKSRVLCEKGLFLSMKYPGNIGIIIRKTFASLRLTTMQTWFRDVCPPDFISNYNQLTQICELQNGSKVIFVGIDDPLKLGSLEAGWVGIDEAVELDEQDYMMLLGRLRYNRVPFRQIFCTTNPGSPTHWLYRRAYLDHQMEIFESNSAQNPYLPKDYIDSLSTFTGTYHQRYVEGRWVGFEGLVYDTFDPAKHIIRPFEVPPHWKRYRTIDFGYANPFVCQFWAQAPSDEDTLRSGYQGWYLYREIYYSHRVVEDHARQILSLSQKESSQVVATFCDWAAEERATLERHGIPTIPANKDISAGIQTVHRLISANQVHFFEDCTVEVDHHLANKQLPHSTVQEFSNYRWQKVKVGKNEKEMPQDKDNHGMDAMRYLFHTLEAKVATMHPIATRPKPPRLRIGTFHPGRFRDRVSLRGL